jgi:hypothetical protein
MFDFFHQIGQGFSLLPSYLQFLTIFLIILPTIIAILLRFYLERHLHFLSNCVTRISRGVSPEEQPKMLRTLEVRFQQASQDLDQINTAALIDGVYSQERFFFLGLSLRCESVDYFSRILPNLLLSFGLLGTFLGITINLANISQTISQVEIDNIRSLVQELNQPLQGMGIAFVTSLIAVACSALLTVINLSWNTSLAKSELINLLEDYLDNIYLPQLPSHNPVEESVNQLVNEFGKFLARFEVAFAQVIEKSLGERIEQFSYENQQVKELVTQVYSGLIDSSRTIEKSATSFQKAANVIEQTRFAEKLSAATADLAIAQNQFSQSSLVLHRSTQSLEETLRALQRSMQRVVEISEEISILNQRICDDSHLNQDRRS